MVKQQQYPHSQEQIRNNNILTHGQVLVHNNNIHNISSNLDLNSFNVSDKEANTRNDKIHKRIPRSKFKISIQTQKGDRFASFGIFSF